MKNKNPNTELSSTFKLADETFCIDLDGYVHSESLGSLGHMEELIEIAKWFSDVFAIMDEIEGGLTDVSEELS